MCVCVRFHPSEAGGGQGSRGGSGCRGQRFEWMCHTGLSAAPFSRCLSLSARRSQNTRRQMSFSHSSAQRAFKSWPAFRPFKMEAKLTCHIAAYNQPFYYESTNRPLECQCIESQYIVSTSNNHNIYYCMVCVQSTFSPLNVYYYVSIWCIYRELTPTESNSLYILVQ